MRIKNGKSIAAAAFFLATAILTELSFAGPVDPSILSPALKKEWLICKTDSDCVSMMTSCTQCREYRAINFRYKPKYDCYKTSACKQLISNGGGKTLCSESKADSEPKAVCLQQTCTIDPKWEPGLELVE